jgi:hypothetical protein
MLAFAFIKNDCEVFTSSPLYLEEGDYFSEDEFVAADGAFEGDGCLKCSYKIPGNDEVNKLVLKTLIKELVHNFPYWVTISISYHIWTEHCSSQFMLQSGYIIIL